MILKIKGNKIIQIKQKKIDNYILYIYIYIYVEGVYNNLFSHPFSYGYK